MLFNHYKKVVYIAQTDDNSLNKKLGLVRVFGIKL